MKNIRKALGTSVAVTMAITLFFGCIRSGDDGQMFTVTSTQDINFMRAAAISNYTELTLAGLDTAKGTNSEVTIFAKLMISDHTAEGKQIHTLAQIEGLSAPDSLSADHTALRDQLLTLSGRAFDSVYIHSQVADHQVTLALFMAESTGGQDQRVRQLAGTLVPTLQMHLDKATALAANF